MIIQLCFNDCPRVSENSLEYILKCLQAHPKQPETPMIGFEIPLKYPWSSPESMCNLLEQPEKPWQILESPLISPNVTKGCNYDRNYSERSKNMVAITPHYGTANTAFGGAEPLHQLSLSGLAWACPSFLGIARPGYDERRPTYIEMSIKPAYPNWRKSVWECLLRIQPPKVPSDYQDWEISQSQQSYKLISKLLVRT